MSLPIGSRLASFEITALLGVGGMGEVYRARDTKLNRDVALKILPASLGSDTDRLARFRREAQVLASLNHPNIAQVYDAGAQETQPGSAPILFIAMELVPGQTLADLIANEGALAPQTAVAVAGQIADALEAAHEQGIVHRDLKPANVKRREDGTVKVLDFGLARSGADRLDPPSDTGVTTLSPAVTELGVILGTAAYMSPEQAKGRPADKRADIWAFGVVLYEMLTGRRPFGGDTVAEVMAAVIKDAPSLEALPATTPPALRHLIARCLERDPRERLRDIGEARIALRTALDPANPLNRTGSGAAGMPPMRRRTLTWALVGTGALALAALSVFLVSRAGDDGAAIPVRRFDLPVGLDETRVVISPDGSRLAYRKGGHLKVHLLRTATSVDLGEVPPSTSHLFWSPDGGTIGYVAEAALRTVSAAGGPSFTVCKVPASGRVMGAAWRPDGTIVFSVWRDNLYQVPATGGVPALRVAIKRDTEIDFHGIVALPGDRLIVTTHLRSADAYRQELIEGDKRTTLSTDADIDVFAFQPPNELLFVRERVNPGVWVAPFDGHAADFAKARLIEPGALGADAASDGTIVSIIPVSPKYELVWVAQSGAVSALSGPPFESAAPSLALSPDGKRAALSERSQDGRDAFVVRDLVTGTDTRIPPPQGPDAVATGGVVRWAPDGRLLYPAGGIETTKIYDWPADGSANGRELASGIAAVIAPNHELIFIGDERGKMRLFHAPIGADGSAGRAVPVFVGADEPSVRDFDLSPDGRLLAFTVQDRITTQLSVFVATYPDLRERRQVVVGGTLPKFSRDGRQLFFASGTRTADGVTHGQLQVVSVATAPLVTGPPTVLMTEGDGLAAGERPIGVTAFDTAADGRLLMSRRLPAAAGEETRVVLLQNWPASIRR